MPKLAIYFPTFAPGGVERQCINMSAWFRDAGYEVTFLVDRNEGPLARLIPPGIAIVELNAPRTISAIAPMARFLRRERPDILLSNMSHPNLVAILGRRLARSDTRLIAAFHSHLSSEIHDKDNWKFKSLPTFLRMFLRQADAVVAVSDAVASDLAGRTGLPRDRITTIYNPAVPDDLIEKSREPVRHDWFNGPAPVIVAVGRLVALKDFSMLLRAFAKVVKARPAKLIILGEGPLREQLHAEAEALSIEGVTDFPGYVANPFAWMKRAALLVMPSRYEGFGNVLAEALACGTPVVSTNCEGGPAEILANGEYGELTPVGDADQMAGAIVRALEAPHDKAALIARSRLFTVEAAARRYLDLFRRLQAEPCSSA